MGKPLKRRKMNNLARSKDELHAKLLNLKGMINQGYGDFLSKSSPKITEIAVLYAQLAALPNRSEEENDNIEKILDAANDNQLLSFWTIEIDHILAHSLGLLDEDDRESYQDQQALLMEYVETRHDFTAKFDLPGDRMSVQAIISSISKGDRTNL